MIKKNILDRYSINDPILTSFNYLILFIAAAAVILPFAILIFVSMKSSQEYATTGLFTVPENLLNIRNFVTVLYKNNGIMITGFKNSLILIVISVLISVLLGTMAAYALTRFEFPLKKVILSLFFLVVLIPKETTHVATFGIIKSLGLFNTRMAAILLYIGTDIIQLMIFLQFIGKIPMSIDESARIDGAKYWQIFIRMILPLMKPAITTAIIIKSVWLYNDLFIPYLYMTKDALATVSTALMQVGSHGGSARLTDWPIMSAAVIIAIIPTLIIFFLFQRNIVSGLAEGSTK